MQFQYSGDKSGELSVRTQDLLEEASEASEEEGNNPGADDQILDENDDDLSVQMSIADPDLSVSGNALGTFDDDDEDDEDDNGGASDGELLPNEHEEDGDMDSSTGSRSDDDDRSEGEDDESEGVSVSDDEEGIRRRQPQHDAHNVLQDLIEIHGGRNQVSFDQYERSLRQLYRKWESILDQMFEDQDQQLDNADMEREELELQIEEMRDAHENELDAQKQELLEQSQKIVLEELKANTDRELRSEESAEIAVQKAVENTKREMEEDFEIALSGMQQAQEELKHRYEKLVKETEIRVRDEVETGLERDYENKTAMFREQCDELKQQVLDQTMLIQDLEMKVSANEKGAEEVDEIKGLQKTLQKTIKSMTASYKSKIQELTSSYEAKLSKKDEEMADKSSYIDPQAADAAVQKAIEDTKKELQKEFDLERRDLIAQYEEKDRKDIENRIFGDSDEDEPKSESNMSGLRDDFERTKKELMEKINQIQDLETTSEAKDGKMKEMSSAIEAKDGALNLLDEALKQRQSDLEAKDAKIKEMSLQLDSSDDPPTNQNYQELEDTISQLVAEVQTKLTLIETKDSMIDTKNKTIEQLGTIIDSKNSIIETKNNEIKQLAAEVTTKSTHIEANDSKTEQLVSEIETKSKVIKQLGGEIEAKNQEIKKLQGDIGTQKNSVGMKEKEMKSKIGLLEVVVKTKDNLVATKDDTIRELKIELDTKDNTIETKTGELKSFLESKNKEIVELHTKMKEMKLQIDNLKREKESEVNTVVDSYKAEISSLQAAITERDEMLGTKKSEYESALKTMRAQFTAADEKYATDIQSLKEEAIQQQETQPLRDEQSKQLQSLRTELDELKVKSEKALEEVHKEHEQKTKCAEEQFKEAIDKLKRDHTIEVKELEELNLENNKDLKSRILAMEKDRETVRRRQKDAATDVSEMVTELKKKHQKIIKKMKEQHGRESSDALNLIYHLRAEKDGMIAAMASKVPARNTSSAERKVKKKKAIHREPTVPPRIKKMIDGVPQSEKFQLVEDDRHRNTNGEALECNETPSPTSKQLFHDLSPLTMTSPSARSSAKAASRIPKSTDRKKKKVREKSKVTPGRHATQVSNVEATSNSSKKHPSSPGTKPSRKESLSGTSTAASPRRILSSPKKTPNPPLSSNPSSTKHVSTPSRMVSPTATASHSSSVVPAHEIRIMIINIPVTDKIKKMVRGLKLSVVDSPLEATHVIAGNEEHHIRRTAKFMAALCVTSKILKVDWLEESYKHKCILGSTRYRLLNDRTAEKMYAFSMKQTIKEGNERRKEGGLLTGWSIFVCPGVAGNRAPKESDLRMMIEAASGSWLERSDIDEQCASHVIVLTSNPATPSQLEDEKAKLAAESGAGFFTTSWLFDVMMHQKLYGIKRGLGF